MLYHHTITPNTQTEIPEVVLMPVSRSRALLLCGLIWLMLVSSAEAQRKRVLEPIAAKLEPTRKVVYKQVGDRELHLEIFEPEGHQPTDKRAVFLAIHGGGWTGGEPRWFYPIADHFRDLGMVGISLEYRLLKKPEGTTVFDCVKDGRSAVRYIREHAGELGIDPDKIVVAGGSAGGHVAAGTALFDGVDESTDDKTVSCVPNASVLYYPVIDTSAEGYGRQKIGDDWQTISPLHQVKPHLPPTIVFHGTADTVTPYKGAVEFQKKMLAAGNKCELVSHEGGVHGYFIFDLELYEAAMKRTEQFLRDQKLLN